MFRILCQFVGLLLCAYAFVMIMPTSKQPTMPRHIVAGSIAGTLGIRLLILGFSS